jgi:hypothetical protein
LPRSALFETTLSSKSKKGRAIVFALGFVFGVATGVMMMAAISF